ncbi:MAG TPA: transposase [Brumimicrobium sp.]|nr:transposase [Brumimicrobium sp.]
MKKSNYPNRKSIRLNSYDYASIGRYFVTINAIEYKHIFGQIKNGVMYLSRLGEILEEEWLITGEIRKNIKLHSYVVMPNHFHAIVEICYSLNKDNIPGEFVSPKQTLPAIIRSFKSTVTRRSNAEKLEKRNEVWHGRFHDRIIRDDKEYMNVTKYIEDNIKNWPLN